MNLLEILTSRINGLPEGGYTQGLKAVLQHVQVTANHLVRGQSTADDAAFTDAIYRTNQAFEGSLKEAFRVLAGKDPAGSRPFDIENYFQQQNALRPRVLAQFTNYRTEWRNPSVHDYRLAFDEDEALLAIVTVSAFAIVLIDQIAERISFEEARAGAAAQPTPNTNALPFVDRIVVLLEQFTVQFNQSHTGQDDIRQVELIGALAGFLASAASDVNTQIDGKLLHDRRERPDLLLTSATERLILEIKRVRRPSHEMLHHGLQQVSNYMAISGITQAVLYWFYSPNSGKTSRSEHTLPSMNGRIIVVSTEPARA